MSEGRQMSEHRGPAPGARLTWEQVAQMARDGAGALGVAREAGGAPDVERALAALASHYRMRLRREAPAAGRAVRP